MTRGVCLGARCIKVPCVFHQKKKSPLCSESSAVKALAALESAVLAVDLSLELFILEGDCRLVFSGLTKHDMGPTYLQHILYDTLEICKCFSSCSFFWTPRFGNSAAYRLAAFGKSSDSCLSWLGALNCIIDVIVQHSLNSNQ